MTDIGPSMASPAYLQDILNQTPAYAGPIWITSPQTITSNLTVPATCSLNFTQGGTIRPNNGVTVSLLGEVRAGIYQIFDLTLGGIIDLRSNVVQDIFTAEWWINNYYNTGVDYSPFLGSMQFYCPDYSEIIFRSKGTLVLGFTWLFTNRTGLKIRAERHNEELPAVTLQCGNTIIQDGHGIKPAITMIGCGHCEISGFQINCVEPSVNCCGIVTYTGGFWISTNNTFMHNRIENQGANANWVGIYIGADGGSNHEAMQIIGNYLNGGGTASAGKGTGISLGQNSNNHMHYLFRNTTTGCRYGVDGQWFGAHISHHVSESDQTVFMVRHLPYPVLIEYPDVESSQTILDTTATGGESSITVRCGRYASCGASGVGWFEFGGATPTVLLQGNDYQNYNSNNSYLYHLPWLGSGNPGQCIKLLGNNYSNLLGQGFPNANFIVRTGSTGPGQLLPILSDAEAVTGGTAPAPQLNPAALTISAGAINLNGAQVNSVNSGSLTAMGFATGMGYGPGMTNAPPMFVFIRATGGAITVGSGSTFGCFKTAGTIAQDTIQQFMFDPSTNLWYWVN